MQKQEEVVIKPEAETNTFKENAKILREETK